LSCSVSNTDAELPYKLESSLVFVFFILKVFQNIDVATTGVIYIFLIIILSTFFFFGGGEEMSLVFAKFNFSLIL